MDRRDLREAAEHGAVMVNQTAVIVTSVRFRPLRTIILTIAILMAVLLICIMCIIVYCVHV